MLVTGIADQLQISKTYSHLKSQSPTHTTLSALSLSGSVSGRRLLSRLVAGINEVFAPTFAAAASIMAEASGPSITTAARVTAEPPPSLPPPATPVPDLAALPLLLERRQQPLYRQHLGPARHSEPGPVPMQSLGPFLTTADAVTIPTVRNSPLDWSEDYSIVGSALGLDEIPDTRGWA